MDERNESSAVIGGVVSNEAHVFAQVEESPPEQTVKGRVCSCGCVTGCTNSEQPEIVGKLKGGYFKGDKGDKGDKGEPGKDGDGACGCEAIPYSQLLTMINDIF